MTYYTCVQMILVLDLKRPIIFSTRVKKVIIINKNMLFLLILLSLNNIKLSKCFKVLHEDRRSEIQNLNTRNYRIKRNILNTSSIVPIGI